MVDKKYWLHFVGIDFWCRPVFRRADTKHLYGSADILVDPWDNVKEVLNKITIKDITYFGTVFDDDPLGRPINENLVFAPLEELENEEAHETALK